MATVQPPLIAENLEEQLENVVEFLSRFWDFKASLFWRFSWRSLFWMFLYRDKLRLESKRDILSGKGSDVRRAQYVDVTTPEERASDVYEALVGDFSYHLTSQFLVAAYPEYNFRKLKTLHEQRQQDRRLQFNAAKVAGVVLAAFEFVLKDVPPTIVEKNLGMSFEKFERGLFFYTIFVFVYICIVLLPIWRKLSIARRKHKYIAEVLGYVALVLEGPGLTGSGTN